MYTLRIFLFRLYVNKKAVKSDRMISDSKDMIAILFSSQQIVTADIEKVGKKSDVTSLRFVDASLPIVYGFLTYADSRCEFLLGQISLYSQFFYRFAYIHNSSIEEKFLNVSDIEEIFLYNY